MTQLLSYFAQDKENLELGRLNQTISGYISKIVTFYCLKRPHQVLDFLDCNHQIIKNLTNHIYLTECISDILVKFICLRTPENLEALENVQQTVMESTVASLGEEKHELNDEFHSQALGTLNSTIRRCYLVINSKDFFQRWFFKDYLEVTMGESVLSRLIKFIFERLDSSSKQNVIK